MGRLLAPMDCGTVWVQTTLTPTSCLSATRLSTLASSFLVTRVAVTSSVLLGVVILPRLTSVQRQLVPTLKV